MTKELKIGDLVDIAKGKKATISSDRKLDNYIRFIQIEDLRSNSTMQYTINDGGVIVDTNDLCIAWDGANAGIVGYNLKGRIGSTIARLRPKNRGQIYSPYLGRFLQSNFKKLNSSSTGATIPHVRKDYLENLSLKLPPLPEQKRIAEILDKADAIRRKRKETIQLLDQFRNSLFFKMFIDTSNSWPEVKISELAADVKSAMRTGPFGSDLKHGEFVNEGIAVLGIDNVVSNEFKWGDLRFITPQKYNDLKRYTVKPGDVLITIMGTVGRSCVVPHDIPISINTKHLAALTLNQSKVFPEFLSKVLLIHPGVTAQLKKSEKGAIMAGLNLGIIKNLKFNLPPLSLQKEYVDLFNKSKGLTKKNIESNISIEHLFQSLTHRAFKGEL